MTGALSISDVDADDSPSFAAATTAGTYGSFTVGTDGSWSYVLDADDADTDALDAGDNVTETFTVTASDGTTQTVTLSITGLGRRLGDHRRHRRRSHRKPRRTSR